MRRHLNDFAKNKKKQSTQKSISYYDIYDDWDLIEASFLKQYGVRLRSVDDMSWCEFCTLLSGIMPDTPLGSIVSIRCEKDPKVIKAFTPDQRRIYNEWRKKIAQDKLQDMESYDREMENLSKVFKSMFYKPEK